MSGPSGLAILAGALVLVLSPQATAAENGAEACSAAHRAAQKERRDSHLVEARARLLVCSREECPTLIRRDCTDWLVEVAAETPTVVIEPRTRSGAPITGARASVDGAPFAPSLDGKALPIDPGEHAVRVEAPGYGASDQRAMVLAGEHAQRIVATLDDLPPPPPPKPSREGHQRRSGVPAIPIVLGSVGVVGLGLFGGFGLAGASIKSDLDDAGCRPRCDPDRVDQMWQRFTVADVSLAVGLVALTAGALYWALSR